MSATPVERPFHVCLLMVTGGVLMAMMVVFARLAAESHAIVEITFFRNAIGAVCIAILIAGHKDRVGMYKTRRPVAHFGRGLIGVIGLGLNFWAATLLPLADAAALFYAMPLLATLLAIPLLKERVDWRRWICVIIGFAGILVIAQPGAQGGALGITVALLGALSTAFAVILVRSLGQTEPELRIVFYFFLIGALLTGMLLPWHWTPPSFESFVWLLATSLAGTLGQILITRAYAQAPAAFTGPFNYLAIVYSAFFGWLLWGEVPATIVFIGAGIVAAAGIANLLLEKARQRRAEEEVEATLG